MQSSSGWQAVIRHWCIPICKALPCSSTRRNRTPETWHTTDLLSCTSCRVSYRRRRMSKARNATKLSAQSHGTCKACARFGMVLQSRWIATWLRLPAFFHIAPRMPEAMQRLRGAECVTHVFSRKGIAPGKKVYWQLNSTGISQSHAFGVASAVTVLKRCYCH